MRSSKEKTLNKESKQQMITEHLANQFCCLCFDHSPHKSMNRKTAVRTGPRKFSSVYITILAQRGAGKKGGTAAWIRISSAFLAYRERLTAGVQRAKASISHTIFLIETPLLKNTRIRKRGKYPWNRHYSITWKTITDSSARIVRSSSSGCIFVRNAGKILRMRTRAAVGVSCLPALAKQRNKNIHLLAHITKHRFRDVRFFVRHITPGSCSRVIHRL